MENDNINVFYSCHKEPTNLIKDNFEWKLFENKGLEWGGYQQAYEHLDNPDKELDKNGHWDYPGKIPW